MFVPKQPKYKPTRSTSLRDPSPALQKLGPESSTVQKNLEELAARSGKTAEADSPIVRPPKEEGESSCRRGHKKLAMLATIHPIVRKDLLPERGGRKFQVFLRWNEPGVQKVRERPSSLTGLFWDRRGEGRRRILDSGFPSGCTRMSLGMVIGPPSLRGP